MLTIHIVNNFTYIVFVSQMDVLSTRFNFRTIYQVDGLQ